MGCVQLTEMVVSLLVNVKETSIDVRKCLVNKRNVNRCWINGGP